MFCPNCGKVLNDDVKFCGACGTPMNNTVADFIENETDETVDEVLVESVVCVPDVQMPKVSAEQEPIASNEQLPKLFGEQMPEVYEEPETNGSDEDSDKAPEKKGKGKGVLKGILATVYCVLIFMFMAIGISLLTARSGLASENIKSVVNEIDSSMAENLLTEHSLFKDFDADKNKEMLKETISESTIPGFVGEKLGEYGDYLLGGDKPEEIVRKDIVGLFEENKNVADMFFKFKPFDDRNDRNASYERYYEKSLKPVFEEFYTNEKINKTIDVSRIVLSIWVLIGVAVIAAALIYVLIRLKAKKGAFLNWLGWTFTVIGALYLLAYVTAIIVRLFVPGIGSGTKGLIGIALESIALDVIIIGGSILVAGILMLVIKKLISKKAKKA